MKLLAGSILILLVMVQTFSSWLIVADYAINKEFIAKNLCINKTRPKLRCNGKCQLMKKIAEEEKQDRSSGSQTGKIKMDLLFNYEIQSLSIAGLPGENIEFHSHPFLKQSPGLGNAIFHPPAAA